MFKMPKAHVMAALALAAAGALATVGCRVYGGPGHADVAETAASPAGTDPYYDRYLGPLHAERPYYKTIERITFTEQGGDYDPAISPDGTKMIYASTAQSTVPDIYMKTVTGGKVSSTVSQLTSTPWAEIQPCFSPDGRLFAYASNRRGRWDICIEPLAGPSGPRYLTENLKSDSISPNWHPGGEWMAFSNYNLRSQRWEMAVKNVKTGQLRIIGEGLFPKFSPDGRQLAFQRARERSPRWYSIWTIEVDEDFNVAGAPTEIVSSAKWAAINPAWSPDGNYLAFATVHESPEAQGCRRILMGDDIWVVNLHGQDLTKLTDSPEPESHPAWARAKDGRNGRIYFCSMQYGPKNIFAMAPVLPQPYGSVAGPLPGPAPENAPPRSPEGKAPPPEPPAPEKAGPAKVPDLPPPADSRPE